MAGGRSISPAGRGVPGFTAVDLALAVVIRFLLVALTTRTLRYLWSRVRAVQSLVDEAPPSAPKRRPWARRRAPG